LKNPLNQKIKPRILIVEDNLEFRGALIAILAGQDFWVLAVSSGEEAIAKAEIERPHLILLDKGLPDRSGFDVCRELKSRPTTAGIPIIFLSGEGDAEVNVVDGLDLGAEDFIAKPVKATVLLARVHAVLRRQGGNEDEPDILSIHNLRIDKSRHRIWVNDQDVQLSPTELKILLLLVKRPGWVYSRQQIVEHLNDGVCAVTERSVDVQMAGLRKKLGADAAQLIETVRSVGYRILEPSVSE